MAKEYGLVDLTEEKSREEIDYQLILYRQIEAIVSHASTLFLEPPFRAKLKTFLIAVDNLESLLMPYHDDQYLKTKKEIDNEIINNGGINFLDKGRYYSSFQLIRKKFEALIWLMAKKGFLPPRNIKLRF